MDLAGLTRDYGYLAIVLGSFLEGETAVAFGGYAAQQGLLSIPLVVALGAGINFAWDQLYFHLGRAFGPRLLRRSPALAHRGRRVFALLERYDAALIVGVRLMYGLRAAGPLALGMTRVAAWRFFWLNALGAALWGLAVAGAGFAFGRTLELLFRDAARLDTWILFAFLGGGVLWWVVRMLRAGRRGAAGPW
ncbi:MAG TPA: DedA family protein [Burkholderiales bacterium]|nr:DedA family protein [Burkholderiales bacterium]